MVITTPLLPLEYIVFGPLGYIGLIHYESLQQKILQRQQFFMILPSSPPFAMPRIKRVAFTECLPLIFRTTIALKRYWDWKISHPVKPEWNLDVALYLNLCYVYIYIHLESNFTSLFLVWFDDWSHFVGQQKIKRECKNICLQVPNLFTYFGFWSPSFGRQKTTCTWRIIPGLLSR